MSLSLMLLTIIFLVYSVTRSKARMLKSFNIKECFIAIPIHMGTDCLSYLNATEPNEQRRRIWL